MDDVRHPDVPGRLRLRRYHPAGVGHRHPVPGAGHVGRPDHRAVRPDAVRPVGVVRHRDGVRHPGGVHHRRDVVPDGLRRQWRTGCWPRAVRVHPASGRTSPSAVAWRSDVVPRRPASGLPCPRQPSSRHLPGWDPRMPGWLASVLRAGPVPSSRRLAWRQLAWLQQVSVLRAGPVPASPGSAWRQRYPASGPRRHPGSGRRASALLLASVLAHRAWRRASPGSACCRCRPWPHRLPDSVPASSSPPAVRWWTMRS